MRLIMLEISVLKQYYALKSELVYLARWLTEIQRRSEDRELHEVRPKTDTVDRPVRTAHTFVHHYTGTQYCNTKTVFPNIPLPSDQHHILDVAEWR